jgi:ASPIC and UnbV/FG-GAP-like repeat
MGDLLRKIYDATDWKTDPNKQALRARYYQDLLQSAKLSVPDRLQVELQLASELLQAGASAQAVGTIEQLRKEASAAAITLPSEFDLRVRKLAAISYFRLGEQENCLNMDPGTRRACIFPIDTSGRHHKPRGAEGAVRELTQLLDINPHDALSQWLLNVAYMQLGEYPQQVPPRWLIPANLFRSEANIGNFENVASAAGLAVMGHAGGAVMDDFDGDGLLDIIVSSSGPLDSMHFFHNNGDGTFSDRTRQAGLEDEIGGLNLIAADYDNDGHTDLLVLRGGWWARDGEYPFSLLRNRGDGTFEDVTVKAGLLSLAPTQTAAWADYDGDGWLDLYVGHESGTLSGPGNDPRDRHPSQLFHNNHDGTFTEVGASMGLDITGYIKGVAWGDFNNDGRPDLYVSDLNGPNHLFRNDGPQPHGGWKFTDVTRQAGVADPIHSFATWFFDYDNDGWPDLFVAGYSVDSENDVGAFEMGKPNHAELPRLYHNNHDGTFTDVTHRTHLDRAILVMGASFGDLDNDGWLDIYLGTGDSTFTGLLPNRMFRNDQGRAFQDITTSGGFGHLQKGHSIAFGDPGNNGHEDVFEEMGGALPGDLFTSVLYRNPGNSNHWIELDLEGVKANRSAIGARLDLAFTDGGVLRHVVRTVGFASSFGGNPLRQHIGLGKATVVRSLEIRWPGSGTVQRFTNIAADHIYHLREGSSPQLLHLKTFRIGTSAKAPMPPMPGMP